MGAAASRYRELVLNKSGYKDYTAYEAILRYEREEMEKEMRNEVAAGEIRKMESQYGDEREVLVLCVHDTYVNYLTLYTAPGRLHDSNELSINSIRRMYLNCGKVAFAGFDKLVDYVKTVPERDFAEIKDAIAQALGLEVKIVQSKKTEEPESAAAHGTMNNSSSKEMEELRQQKELADAKLVEVQAECKVYKTMLYSVVPALAGKEVE